MLKPLAAAVFFIGSCCLAFSAVAVEMAVPMEALASSSSGDVETAATVMHERSGSGSVSQDSATASDASATSSTNSRTAADNASPARADATHTAVGADAATGDATNPTTRRNHRRAYWQSLLPGVMK